MFCPVVLFQILIAPSRHWMRLPVDFCESVVDSSVEWARLLDVYGQAKPFEFSGGVEPVSAVAPGVGKDRGSDDAMQFGASMEPACSHWRTGETPWRIALVKIRANSIR